jgi:peptidoglycan-associated lipoprotein
MNKSFIIVLVLALSLIISNCAPKRIVHKPEQQPIVTPEKTREEAVEVKPEEEIPEERITERELAKIETKELETPKYIEEKTVFEDIHFDFDKYDIRPDAKQTLQALADWLIKNPSSEAIIEGHCDERGTNEYNLALGDRRAEATKDYLIALGISSIRLETISYGEEKPLCRKYNEECWQSNRRTHFVIVRGR